MDEKEANVVHEDLDDDCCDLYGEFCYPCNERDDEVKEPEPH